MTLSRRTTILGALALAFTWASAGATLADRKRGRRDWDDDDDDDDGDDEEDHKAAARARAAGEILPLIQIIEHVQSTHPGEVVGIELERDDGRWIYEIKLVTPPGHYLEIYVDARDKRILKVEGQR